MRKITKLLLFLTFAVSANLYSQNRIEYFYLRNKAEVQIVRSNYDSALVLYQKAFDMKGYIHSRDLFNAAICAAKTPQKNRDLGIKYLEMLSHNGVAKHTMYKSCFKPLRKGDLWKKTKKTFKRNIKNARSLWNDSLKLVLKKLVKRDQEFRLKPGSYSVYGDTILYLDSLNIEELKKIISIYGYPNEQIIGKKRHLAKNLNHYVIIRHYYQNKGFEMSKILYNEVKKGNLSPRVFCELEDKKNTEINNHDKYGTVIFFNLNGKEIKQNYSAKEIKTFNKNRRELGLESIEEYIEKIIFMRKNTPFDFNIYEGEVTVISAK